MTKELKLDLTNNFNLRVEMDRDADNWFKIEGFELPNFAPEWKYEVSDKNGSKLLLELDTTNGVTVDIIEGSVMVEVESGALEAGIYYHRLYADTEDADSKFRFGGDDNLIVNKY